MILWKSLDSPSKLEEAIETSFQKDVVIFKHSTSCSISHMAKLRLDESWDLEGVETYYLDLKTYRALSDEIAEKFQVFHESPQVLLIRNGECFYDASHFDISVGEIKETLDWHVR